MESSSWECFPNLMGLENKTRSHIRTAANIRSAVDALRKDGC